MMTMQRKILTTQSVKRMQSLPIHQVILMPYVTLVRLLTQQHSKSHTRLLPLQNQLAEHHGHQQHSNTTHLTVQTTMSLHQ
jgi:hypothetical protein